MNGITAIILAKNEECNIERCILSVKDMVDRIVLVDSGSSDLTVDIAKRNGAEVFVHPFKHYAAQFNWAIDNVNLKTKWVFRLDADEVVTPELKKEILEECNKHAFDDVNGFLIKYRLYFLGRFLKHGGAYPFVKISLFKVGCARFEERAMGEHIVLSSGYCLTLKNDCLHYDCKDLNAFIEKHNAYASREVQDFFERQNITQSKLYDTAERTKKLRDGFYYRLPKYVRAKLYYWYRYYFKLGFLDGEAGRVYAFFQAYFYRYLVDAKLYECSLRRKQEDAQ